MERLQLLRILWGNRDFLKLKCMRKLCFYAYILSCFVFSVQ